jgi:PAS domain S-box-containing protein
VLDAALTFSTDGLSYKLAATAMVVLGFVMLLRALHVAGQISRHKRRRCCSSWNISLILVRSFLVAYGAFLAIVLLQPGQATFVLTAAVFLGGAIFVWLVIKASVETVEEISRLIENAPDAIVLADVERNTIVDVNENACRLSGRPREAMIGANLNLLCGAPASEGRPSLGNVWRQQLGNNATSSFEWVCGSTSGNGTPCEVRLSELSEDGVSLLRISLVDISARRQAEMAMRMSQERFAKVFHGSPDYITITRLSDGMILDANEGFEQVCGWPREEAIGKTSLELGIWVDAAERDSAIQTIERDGGIRNHEFRFGRRDGTERVGLLSASTILDGTERLLVAIIRDMTELKQAQRALQAANDQLESRVAERTAELSASNEQLRTTLETLQYAQDELVRT